MPRYFIDFRDGHQAIIDEQGSDWPTFAQARKEAVETLPNVGRTDLPDGHRLQFETTIRDEHGTALYRATLWFHGEHLLAASSGPGNGVPSGQADYVPPARGTKDP